VVAVAGGGGGGSCVVVVGGGGGGRVSLRGDLEVEEGPSRLLLMAAVQLLTLPDLTPVHAGIRTLKHL